MRREVLDLFSGAVGGWSLGMHRAGFRTVAACEVIPWRRALYAENNPDVRLYDDVRTLSAERLRRDLGRSPRYVFGSPPCQDISSANTKGKGVHGGRSSLYFEAVRLIGEIRPCWFALENSANLRTRGADAVLSALEGLGYACWPFVVSAGDIGANHERKRSWLIGCDVEQVAAHADRVGEYAPSLDGEMGELQRMVGDCGRDDRERNTPHPDQARQARQAHGCMVCGIRQEEIADDGCRSGRSDDEPLSGQMGLCAPDRGDPVGSGHLWSLADLASRVRLDDGLPAQLAGIRVDVGAGKRQSAASLIVEAFGDSVIPQIPEAIGRAILRTERALAAVYSR